MKKFKKVIAAFFLVLTISLPNVAEASNNDNYNQIIEQIVNAQEEYSDWMVCSLEFYASLYGGDDAKIYNVLDVSGIEKGYIILSDDNKILEYSKNTNPYEKAIIDNSLSVDNVECGYVLGCYQIICGSMTCWINSIGEITAIDNSSNISTYGYVGGTISPQLQNSYNCIVAAISNLIWYYGNNGYSSLISGKTFSVIKANVNTTMKSLGGYANSNIPDTLKTHLGNYYSSSTPIWNPSFSTVQSEINAGYPCLLGFAAGADSYSETVGHMTLCVGWVQISSSYYTCLIDGHSTNTVTKAWSSSYNDYVCKVRLK